MPSVLLPGDAWNLTSPYHHTWHDAHTSAMKGWNDIAQNHPEFVKPLRPAEKYAVLHRHVADHLAAREGGDVRYTERLGFSALLISDVALIRFKHLTGEFRHRVYPTNQQKHLGRQEFTEPMMEQLSLEGIAAPPTVLTLGYMETPAGDAISRVLVVCRTPGLYYYYDVPPGSTGVGAGPAVHTLPGCDPPGPRVISAREEKRRSDEVD